MLFLKGELWVSSTKVNEETNEDQQIVAEVAAEMTAEIEQNAKVGLEADSFWPTLVMPKRDWVKYGSIVVIFK